VDDVSLLQEIQQLGLSRESAELICTPYRTSMEAMQQQLELTSFRLNHLQSVDWRVDQILASSNAEQPLDKVAVIKLGLSDGDSVFEISKERLDVLIHELKQAHGILKR
jgi:phosphoenolpyruvate carboxylase